MLLFIVAIILIDIYVFNGIRSLSKKWKFLRKRWFTIVYVAVSLVLIAGLELLPLTNLLFFPRLLFIMAFFALLLFKVCFAIFALIDDLRRFIIFKNKRSDKKAVPREADAEPKPFKDIPRSEFLLKAGLLAAAVPITAFRLNMKSGLYDYHIKRHQLYLPNLPKSFDGLRIAQISDIHSGSLQNKTAVEGGVEMLMREKADIVLFTGDLVNDFSYEMKGYQDIFSKVKAPLGVFSSFGNHDYGDYFEWVTPAAKKRNHDEIIATHKNMGWDLLRNENRRIKVGGEEIGILGIENWGKFSTFPKYGRVDLALKDTDDLPVKLLLSHDPSHWRAEVLPKYPQIDMVFAGHTHGMQAGIQTADFQWSPIEYIYKEWAGFYTEGKQQIYVNVGYGFIGLQGRVGILPEIAIFELKAGNRPAAG